MGRKKATSSDVAERAGVSQATVSMVLNKKYNVSFSREVIQRVEQAAGAMAAPMLLVSVTPLSTILPTVTWVI